MFIHQNTSEVLSAQDGKINFNKGFLGIFKPKDFDKINTALQMYNIRVQAADGRSKSFAENLAKINPELSNYLVGLKGAEGTMKGYGVHLVGATIKTVALQAASMALNAALTWGVSLAIQFGIKLVQNLWKAVPTLEHLKDKFQETVQALDEINSKEETLNDELKTTQYRISELESKGALSFTDEAELNRLRQYNAELKTQIDLLADDKHDKREELVEDFNDMARGYDNITNSIEAAVYAKKSLQNLGIDELEDDSAGKTISVSGYDDKIKSHKEKVKEVQDALVELYENGFDYSSADEATKKNVDSMHRLIDTYMVATGTVDNLWQQAYSRERFAEVRKSIVDLSDKSSESLFELYNSTKEVQGGFYEFVNYLLSLNAVDLESILGVDDFKSLDLDNNGIISQFELFDKTTGKCKLSTEQWAKVMPLFANELNKVEDAATSTSTAIKSFSNIMSPLQDGYDAIVSAQKDVEEQNYLSADSIKALEEAGLSEYLKETEYGYLLVNDALNTYLESQGKEYKDALDTAISQASKLATMQDAVAAGYKNDAAGLATYLRVLGAANNTMTRNEFKNGLISKGFTASEAHRMWMSSQQRIAADQEQSEYIAAANAIDVAIKNQKTYEMVRKTIKNDEKYNKNSKSSKDKTNEAAEDQIANLKHQHEMGLISEATYYKKLEAIRKKYYAGKKDYLDRDRALQEEYHDWEVKNAEDGFEKKIESLQKKYANGKITYDKFKSELKKLIKKTYKNDKDAQNEHLDELSTYLSEGREQKDEKNREKFDSSYDKYKYQLENGFISESTYYKKLDKLYKKHYGNKTKYLDEYAQYSKEVYDGFKDMYKEDLEADKEALEKKKDAITEYYDKLIEKKRDTHDEEDYKEEQTEKRETLGKIDRQIAELKKVGGERAKARLAELEEERKEAAKELEDFEKDRAREKEIERLEKEKEKREKEVQKKIDNIDTKLGNLDSNTKDIRNAIVQYAKEKGVNIKFAYASGTRSSVGGLGRINEKGVEMISAPDGNGNYIPMLPNSYVFSAKATEFLYRLATDHSLPQAMYNSIAKSIKTQSSTPSVNIAQPISITMGDVIIKGNADKQTVADIKKQQENTVRMVLQKIKELQK